MHDKAEIWSEVSTWPADERRAFAERILHSLRESNAPISVSPERSAALLRLIGIWQSPQPPNDDDVDRIVEQERMRKYA